MQQFPVAILRRPAITEKGFPDCLAIDCKRFVLGTVGPQTATVFVFVNGLQRLVHVPDPAIAVCLFIEGDVFLAKGNRRKQKQQAREQREPVRCH